MKILHAARTVLSETDYKKIFLLSFMLSAVFALFLMNFVSLPGLVYSGQLLFTETATADNALFLLVFSFLLSLSLTLHYYSYKTSKSLRLKEGGAGFFGAFFGLFTSACSVCPPLLLSAAGAPAALAVLPFGGIELKLLSALLLLLSLHIVSVSIPNSGRCSIKG